MKMFLWKAFKKPRWGGKSGIVTDAYVKMTGDVHPLYVQQL